MPSPHCRPLYARYRARSRRSANSSRWLSYQVIAITCFPRCPAIPSRRRLLPNRFLFIAARHSVHLRSCVLLHSGQDVAVKIERNPDARMPSRSRPPRMNATRQKSRPTEDASRACAVSRGSEYTGQIARLGQVPNKFSGKALRPERLAVLLRHDMRLIGNPNADQQQLSGLIDAGATQLLHDQGRHCNGPGPAALVSLNRMPRVVCSVLSTMENCPRSRSPEPQRNAVTSLRRRPHMSVCPQSARAVARSLRALAYAAATCSVQLS